MAATIDDRVAELERANAQLRRQLDACGAELKEVREQQTATAEVLQVINSSPGDLAPVFGAMLEKATELCDAAFGILWIGAGSRFRPEALHGVPPAFAEYLASEPTHPAEPGTGLGRIAEGDAFVHLIDPASTEAYRTGSSILRRAFVDLGGTRTLLTVPLRKDGVLLGALSIYRQEIRAFSERQIALVTSFAAQAVIAMENARLITETREALEQQTATAEVLQVINSSPGNLAPVFDAILEKAIRLCDADSGQFSSIDGQLFTIAAIRGEPRLTEWLRQRGPVRPGPGTTMDKILRGENLIHVIDMKDDEAYRRGDPTRRMLVDVGGYRSGLSIALRKEDRLLGAFSINRKQVQPFTDKQIGLLQSFGAQAAIAIENARLITETREALEQQTATAEVLQVINSSPGELAPVFDAMLEKALHLCGAPYGILWNYDGEFFEVAAQRGVPKAFLDTMSGPQRPTSSETTRGRLVAGEHVVHIANLGADLLYQSGDQHRRALVDAAGAQVVVAVSLRKDDKLLGAFTIYRQEARPFTDKQIALVTTFADQAVIAIENARLLTETREALEQQTATAEVLQVINSSPGDLKPVFDAMLYRAMLLCDASFGCLVTVHDKDVALVAQRNVPNRLLEYLTRQPIELDPASQLGQAIQGGRVLHISDDSLSEAYRQGVPHAVAAVELGGVRTVLHVPLMKDSQVLGDFIIFRQEVRPFSDKQIALLQNFAAQAVIAMENARLITETREALEQQTATAEVLQVINSSPGDLAPVFEAMLERATRLCEATHGHVWGFDGEQLLAVAARGDARFVEWLRQHSPVRPIPGSAAHRIVRGERFVHVADRREEDAYRGDPVFRGLVDTSGVRASLSVALHRDETLLGMINVYRQEVRPFSETQIALLQNFAAQAVIAMENARLLTETREALEQQTATAEVLQVINSSPGDLDPVFDTMLEKAIDLCGAVYGYMYTYDGKLIHPVAMRGDPRFISWWRKQGARVPDPGSPLERALRGEPVVRVADARQEEAYSTSPVYKELVDLGGIRTGVIVALRKDNTALGTIHVFRSELRPFSEKQLALLETFAAQAVIAMENARLLTETREALEQQTATAEVLQVINSSPGDLTPVFDAVIENSMRLCEATQGHLYIYADGQIHAEALRGEPQFIEWQRRRGSHPVAPGSPTERALRGEQIIHIADATQIETYRSSPAFKELIDRSGIRTGVTVALRKDEAFLGTINVYRQEVRPFTDKQIALLQNFAAQAVIAMENARLLTETREALEQQTATAEVLQVINSSPGDLAPVFDAMLDKAMHLCGAAFGTLWTFDGEHFRPTAQHGVPAPYAEYLAGAAPVARPQNSLAARIMRGEPVVHVPDLGDDEPYRAGDPHRGALVDLGGARTGLIVPLFKDAAVLGFIMIYRQEVRPFTDKQIALLQNFAAQAVIAMENARLLTETREALEQQTATAEVLQVINSSPGDLAPVFDAMLEKAMRLCGAAFGVLWTYDGELLHASALRGVAPAFAEVLTRAPHAIGLDNAHGRLLAGEAVVHVLDLEADDAYRSGDPIRRALVELGGGRVLLAVALRTDDALLGIFTIYRQEVRPFSDKQIALLQNFAAQAVIAMENARLLTETREALEQQTATAEVLQVINSSPGDLAPVFDAMLEKAIRLCGAIQGALWTIDGERGHLAAAQGFPAEFVELLRERGETGAHPALQQVMQGERLVHFPDMTEHEHPIATAAVAAGVRALVWVALVREGAAVGAFAIGRREARPFSDKEIALLQNFAAQAVIAMENARLLNELRQRTSDLQESLEYQTATSDVLKVISQSNFDLGPVLENVIETALRLCRAHMGSIFRLEDGVYRWAVGRGLEPAYQEIEMRTPILAGPGTLVGRAALEGRAVQIADAMADPLYSAKDEASLARARTMLGVPLLREGAPIGVIAMARDRVEPFSEKEVALVTTFADQAVIAIENARLFDELRERTAELGRSVEELKMLGEVGQAVSSTLDLRAVLSTILIASLGVTMASAGAVFRYSRAERAFRLVEVVGWDEALTSSVGEKPIAESESAMGEAVTRRTPIQLPDIADRASYPLRDVTLAAGFHSALIVPLVGAERVFGAITLMRQEAGEFPAETVRLMQTLASQSVLAIQNARLFREIADKSEQLALASQHKSQFLANMSHELRTPLNAILGYAELLVDGIYGVLPEKAQGVLERVQNNGKHLLALINDVLDLAKIEAGQLALTLEDYALAEVVRGVVIATEPLAAAKGLKFTAIVQDGMPMAHGDARRVSQVLLNLAGNAIKFTDAGEVEIGAAAEGRQFVLTVRDTGPGIADADQERIFGEFQQIENTDTRKKGGTGLGLAISKRMVEMQGGMISVESAVGRGSTFRVVLPVHVEPALEEAA
jgi:GAF domain-containing protein